MTTTEQPEYREHQRYPGPSEMGRSRVYIVCPFCGNQCTAFLWSLSGGGKLCPGCKAKHDAYGTTRAPVTAATQED
jgi:hypothetical protein